MVQNVEVIGLDEVNQMLNRIPFWEFEAAKKAIAKATLEVQTRVKSNFNSGGLNSRTGRLRRSIQTSMTGSAMSTISGRVYSDMVYAPIQEKGGTIKAKDKYLRVPGGPYLNIPLSSNKTAAGVMRMGAREVFAGGGFIIKSKKGNYLVMSGAGQPMFVLKKQVTIPARLGMMKASEDSIPTLLSELSRVLFEDAN